MDKLKNKKWWDASLTRAIKTVCQTAVGTIGASTMIESVDWKVVLSASLLAGLVSLLTSLGGLPAVDDDHA